MRSRPLRKFEATVPLLAFALVWPTPAQGQCEPGWSPLGSGLELQQYSRISDMAVFDDGSGPALYIVGEGFWVNGVPQNYIAKWDGFEWSTVGGGTDGPTWVVATYDDGSGEALYVFGGFSSAGGVPARRAAKWDGFAWTPLGEGLIRGQVTYLYVATVFDDGTGPALYVGGGISEAGGVSVSGIASAVST